MLTDDPNLPSYVRPELRAIMPQLALMDDIIAGTPRMHAKATTYIRRWRHEEDRTYEIRSLGENCYEGTGRTLSAATGMLFFQPPAMQWNQSEAALKPIWDNVDALGTHGQVLAKRFAEKALRDGLAIILTDHTPKPTVPVVDAEMSKNLRLGPKLAIYDRSQAISWRESTINNRKTLTQIVFYECGTEDAKEFGVAVVHRYRQVMLTRGKNGALEAAWKLWRLAGEGKVREDYRLESEGFFKNAKGQIAPFLPVSIAYAGRTDAAMMASLPLLGVAYANLAHYQISSNLRFYADLCAFPQRKLKGSLMQQSDPNGQLVPGEMKVGPMVVAHVQADGDIAWDELTGTSMEQLAKRIAEKLSEMGQMGLAFLVPQTRMAETAEAKRIDSVAQNATLSTAGQGIEDAQNLALEHIAWFAGIEKANAPRLEITKQFDTPTMDAATMLAWATVFEKMQIDPMLVLKQFQDQGRIAKDVDIEELAKDMMLRLEIRRRQRELEAQSRLVGGDGTGDDDEEEEIAA